MKLRLPTFYPILLAGAVTLHFFTNVNAQSIEANIQVRDDNPSLVRVSGRFVDNAKNRNLSFTRSVAGFSKLGDRISNLKLADETGHAVGFQSAVAGEYVSEAAFSHWSYTLDLSPSRDPVSAAHISWISNVNGLLMFGDLLPLLGNGKKVSGKVVITLPPGWVQLENRVDGTVLSDDILSEVVSIGRDLRYRTVHNGGTAISICFAGEWLFSRDEAVSFARDIYAKMMETFRTAAAKDVYVNIFKFPGHVPPGYWQADTRGRTITIISSDMPFKTQSLQRLHEQLRHEVFHLWIPNGVNLSGNYDWFYEGFALYSSLKAGVALNQIRFEDLLDTLGRVYAIDSRQGNRISLIESSRTRWNGNETYLYARGMFAAFLCDLALLNSSRGKRSVNEILLEIYNKHRFPAAKADGTEAVLSIMRSRTELVPLIDKYILGSGKFQAEAELRFAGLELSNGLRVISKLSGKQKDLLDALGYNNWRRFSR